MRTHRDGAQVMRTVAGLTAGERLLGLRWDFDGHSIRMDEYDSVKNG